MNGRRGETESSRGCEGKNNRAGIAQLVERHVANVNVAGSSPVSRSLFRRRSQVAKAEVCKTSIQRFKSARRLNFFAGMAEQVDARDLKSLVP